MRIRVLPSSATQKPPRLLRSRCSHQALSPAQRRPLGGRVSPSDDLLMLGRALTAGRRRARLLGLLAHTGFGTTIGLLYGGIVRRRLRGAAWARGMQMLLIENMLLWPLTFFADRFHPSMR